MKLQAFADDNKQTQGKFTVGDEKEHNVFMMTSVSHSLPCRFRSDAPLARHRASDGQQDPEIQKVTGMSDPVDVMARLREMKNSFK